jgi:hypothetical protein
MSECLVTYRDNGKSINATAPVSFLNRVEQFIQPPHDIHDFPIDLDLNDSIDLSVYDNRLNKIGLFSSIILTNNYTEITSTITILILNGHEHKSNGRLSRLYAFIKDEVKQKFTSDHQHFTITSCLAAYNGSERSWDKNLNDLVDQIAEAVSSVFNEDVLSEEIINAIQLFR